MFLSIVQLVICKLDSLLDHSFGQSIGKSDEQPFQLVSLLVGILFVRWWLSRIFNWLVSQSVIQARIPISLQLVGLSVYQSARHPAGLSVDPLNIFLYLYYESLISLRRYSPRLMAPLSTLQVNSTASELHSVPSGRYYYQCLMAPISILQVNSTAPELHSLPIRYIVL